MAAQSHILVLGCNFAGLTTGSASENISYDYLVIVLGNHLAFDKIEGFGEHGHTFTDTFYGDEIRRYLHEGGYKGGAVAIGSDRFILSKSDKLPEGFPVGDKVRVVGSRINFKNNPAITAARIEHADSKLILRDENGWSRWQSWVN